MPQFRRLRLRYVVAVKDRGPGARVVFLRSFREMLLVKSVGLELDQFTEPVRMRQFHLPHFRHVRAERVDRRIYGRLDLRIDQLVVAETARVANHA